MLVAALPVSTLSAANYYVSPTGSDLNNGLSPTSPWASVVKVDGTPFAPGDHILFQYGSTFHASLNASSSGTVSAPIVYGAYGNAAAGNPMFSGSDPISNSAFTNSTGTTYQATVSQPVNWVFDNHQFTHEAQDALTLAGAINPADAAADINYVNQTPGSYYYNPANAQLYVNTGSALTGHSLTLAKRANAVFNNGKSNLVFQNLSVSETAQDNGGYGFRAEVGSNIRFENAAAISTGKHAFGAINVTGFVGKNLLANGSPPDLGFGGASAFVAFSDATRRNDTSQWINNTYVNPNGPSAAFISHGDANSIGSVVIQNMVSLGGYGTGIVIYSTGSNEKVVIQGGQLYGSSTEIDTDNSIVNGLTIGGESGSLSINGNHTVVQNSVFAGSAASPFAGHNGALIDGGTNNTIRFNTFLTKAVYGPAIGLLNTGTNTNIYGNIVASPDSTPDPVGLLFNGAGSLKSGLNLFGSAPMFFTGDTIHAVLVNLQQWQAMAHDTNSLVADPAFVDATSGNFSLSQGSRGNGFYHGPLDSSLESANALLGAAHADGSYDAGANPIYGGIGPAITVTGSTTLVGTGTGITLFNSPAVQINAGAVLTLNAPTGHANRSVLVAGTLTFYGSSAAPQGTLDLTGNDLIVHNGDPTVIAAEIAAGFNPEGQAGKQGITTSTASAAKLTALGELLNSDPNGNPIYNTFDGLPVVNTDVLVKYTYFGDANLDGVVDGSDYTLIDAGFGTGLTGWSNGDFNYDGLINGSDYTLIDNAFNSQAVPLNEFASPTATVPEPAAVVAVGCVVLSLLSRRRRNDRGNW